MAVLAVAGLGALGTSALGLGWQAGWLIGSAVGSSLFAPKIPDQFNEGPRLQDLSVSSSAYGAPIPKIYGSMRTNGNIIWASGIDEVATTTVTSSGGKGGGGGDVYTTTYSYFSSFAIAFAEGEAESIIRIWGDSKLIYDTSSTDDFAKIDGLDFTFYKGSEDQLPDPTIEASLGAGNVPAHRGMCYMVFNRLPLSTFGNRIPSITVEIAFKANEVKPVLTGDSVSGRVYAANLPRNKAYTTNSVVVSRVNMSTLEVERVGPEIASDGIRLLTAGPDGNLIAASNKASNSHPVYKINGTTLTRTNTFGRTGRSLSNSSSGFVYTNNIAIIPCSSLFGIKYMAVFGSIFNDVGILEYDNFEYLDSTAVPGGVLSYRTYGVVPGDIITTGDGGGTFYVFSQFYTGGSQIRVHTGLISSDVVSFLGLSTELKWELKSFTQTHTITPDQIHPDGVAYANNPKQFKKDPADGGIIFEVGIIRSSGVNIFRHVKWHPVHGVLWTSSAGAVPNEVNWEGIYAMCFVGSSSTSLVNRYTGEVSGQQSGWPVGIRAGGVYNGFENSYFFTNTSNVVTKIFLNRQESENGSLRAIVDDLCINAGLDVTDFNTDQLNGISVPGYSVTRPMSLRNALDPLANTFFFDVVESDGGLKFVLRGQDSSTTIEDDFLLLKDDQGSRIEERRAMEVELPSRVTVVYLDKNSDYNQGTQIAQRIAVTNSSKNNVNIELPMALDGNAARQAAEVTLASAWNGRTTLEFQTTIDFLRLDPTDVIDVVLDSGVSYKLRITDLEIGADYSVIVRGTTETTAAYVSDVEGATSEGFTPQVVTKDKATEFILPDMPLLRDFDDLASRASRIYSLTTGYSDNDWSGAVTFKSNNGGSSWERFVENLEPTPWGVTNNALGSPVSPFKTDEVNQLIVTMEAGEDELSSVTQLEMLNGENAALVMTNTGEPEIIQFRDVTPNSDGTYTLSGLLRGRRGTDVFCDSHSPGEKFVILDRDKIEAVSLDLSDLNDPLDFKPVPIGSSFDSAETVDRIFTGRDLKPYAPVNFSATLEGDGSVTLDWFRRTRVGGELENGTGTVQLYEVDERYDILILDGPNGNVLREYVDVTTPSVSYPVAEYSVDFPSGTRELTFVVYQKSGTVGRGFPGEETVEVL